MREKRVVTIIDVAEKAGVSISTASRALTGHSDVSSATRKKVLKISEELNYRPSMLAQSLVLGKTSTIGLLVSDISNPFYPALAKSIENASNSYGYIVFLCNTHDNPERSQKYLDRLLAQGVDGIIHASVGEDEAFLERALNAGVPVVVTNRRPRLIKDIDVVVSNNVLGAEAIVTHLLSLGHKVIGHLTGPSYASLSEDRLAGYRQALEKWNVPYNPDIVLPVEFTREGGAEGIIKLLQKDPRPTAVFAINDVVALGALEALHDLGINVPQGLSVVGFDDIEPSKSHIAQLSTVAQNLQKMGQIAVSRLLDAITNPETHQPETILLETQLQVRNTSAKPPTSIFGMVP